MNTSIGSPAKQDASGATGPQQSRDKLVADLKTVVNDAQALIKDALDVSTEGMSAVPAYLHERFSAVKCNLKRTNDAIRSTAQHATAVTNEYIRENPWKSLGFISAASILISIAVVSACACSTRKIKD